MRAWKITAGLVFIALFAAAIAPQLFPSVHRSSHPVTVQAIPEVAAVAAVQAVPALPVIAPVRPTKAPPAVSIRDTGLIPELTEPHPVRAIPLQPIVVEPAKPSFWDDCPACGMG